MFLITAGFDVDANVVDGGGHIRDPFQTRKDVSRWQHRICGDGKSLNLNLSHVRACVRAQILVSTAVSCK